MTVMAIEQMPSQYPGPGGDRGDRSLEAVRVIPAGVVPGTAGTGLGDHDEDLAPGVIEYYTPRRSALARTASATMVAATYTARGAGLTARHSWKLTRWFGHGVRSATFLGYRYVRAHDHQEVIGGRSNSADWNKVERTKRERWSLLAKLAAAVGLVDLGSWWALVGWGHMTALGGSYAVAPAVETAAAVAGLTLYGRYRMTSQLAPEQIVAPDDIDDGEEPFPLSWCRSGADVAECLSRALAFEGIGTRKVTVLGARTWGWEVDVTLKGSTPGKVQAAADQIEAHLALPDGGFMPEPDSKDKAHLVVRLVQSDPFADMPRPEIHAPKSLSVHDVIAMGRSMDGNGFELTLDGLCALVIGAMGAGKTLGALRTLAEALTACSDAVCYDLDPIKGGLAEFGDLMAKRARTPEECEQVLEEVVSYVPARSVLLPKLDMGDRWHASPEHPNLYVFIDEFIQLSPRGKELAIQILRTGRQYGIYLVMAGQEATADALGDAIALIVAYRILMACRFEDVRIAFGPGAGALGWRPDRMKPSVGPVANDAGQAMIMGGPFNRAIRYRFNAYSREQIQRAVPDRVAAGVNRMDADTLLEAGQKLISREQQISLVERLEALGTEDSAAVAALLRLFDEARAKFLPTARIVDAGLAADGVDLQKFLVRLVPAAKSAKETIGGQQVRGWARETVEQAAAALFAPS